MDEEIIFALNYSISGRNSKNTRNKTEVIPNVRRIEYALFEEEMNIHNSIGYDKESKFSVKNRIG